MNHLDFCESLKTLRSRIMVAGKVKRDDVEQLRFLSRAANVMVEHQHLVETGSLRTDDSISQGDHQCLKHN